MSDTPYRPLFIVPTRNRPELAEATVRSLLALPDPRLSVWISDNSNDEAEAARLQALIAPIADARLRYLRPPQPLAMGAHFDWVVQQALAEPTVTHLCTPTDRMLFVASHLRVLLDAGAREARRLIAFPHDHIQDHRTPITLNQHDWTGRLVEIDSATFVRHMQEVGWSQALPRLLNCLAPRRVLEGIRAAYGSVLDSTSPDLCFGYRTLEREDSFLYLDCPAMFDYAMTRSNGHSAARGDMSRDYTDFLRHIGASGLYPDSPMPGFPGTTNAGAQEYNLVRRQSGSAKLEPLNLHQYFELIARDLRDVENPVQRRTLGDTVEHFARDYRASGRLQRDRRAAVLRRVGARLDPAYLGRKLVKTLSKRWRGDATAGTRLLRAVGVAPYALGETVTSWPDARGAVTHALTQPLPRIDGRCTLEYRLGARLIAVVE